MLHYFYLLNRTWMDGTLRPALAESWRRRSFEPCAALCRELLERNPDDQAAVIRAVAGGTRFDRMFWHALVGECLVLGADAMPRLEIAFRTLCRLVAPDRVAADPAERRNFSPFEQVYFGARDLDFGGIHHRPEYVGWNDREEIAGLVSYLHSVDPATWSAAALKGLPELADANEREEELADARASWPALVELYAGAQAARQVIVCERV